MHGYDIVVIGAGTAGLAAAKTAAELGARVLVVERTGPGGQIMNASRIDNLPGYPAGITGVELGPMLLEQATAARAEVVLDTVEAIEADGAAWLVRALEDSYRARAVIVAAGSHRRSLGVIGEQRLLGKGVSHCAACDGPLYRGKIVGVVGGGDTALDEAACLAELAAQVIVLHGGQQLTSAQQVLIDRVSNIANIEFRPETVVEEILGETAVSGVRVRHTATGEIDVLAISAVVPCVGLAPNTAFLNGTVLLDVGGRIVTDHSMRTSLAGVYAAGDIRAASTALLVAAANDGATAAIAAWRDLAAAR